MTRPYNFGAGPAVLPEELLTQACEEMFNWRESGMSVVEISNRSKLFGDLMDEAEADLRDLLKIPSNYRVLFLPGPARAHFSMVPLNFLGGKNTADYLDTGIWSAMAAEEAKRYGNVNIVASGKNSEYTDVPSPETWQLSDDAAYFYLCSNETINGVEITQLPDVINAPVVSDMTSCLLSRPIDVSQYGCIFAGAQKNIAPAGLSIAIVDEALLGNALPITPSVFDYQLQADKKSLFNTNASFSIYMAAMMFKWVKKQGGIEGLFTINQRKAEKLYDAIDSSDFYYNTVAKAHRSMMNVPFLIRNEDLVETFVREADAAGLKALKGHRYVGGLRASIYNAMPEAGVDALLSFMQDFAQRHG